MDCQGKKGLEKQKEALQDITDTIKARSMDKVEYEDAAKVLKEYIGRPLTKEESDVLKVASGMENAVQLRRDDLDALGQYIEHIWLQKGDNSMGATHIIKDHLGDDLNLRELLYLGEVIRKGKADLSTSAKGKINHKYELSINDELYYAIVAKEGAKKHKIITFYKKGGAQKSTAFGEAIADALTKKDKVSLHPDNESIAQKGTKINDVLFPGAQKLSSFDTEKAFNKVADLIGKVDEAIAKKVTGGRAKRLFTVDDLTKRVGEISQDFRVGISQIHEQAAQIKSFLDSHVSPDDSVLLHRALTGDMEAAKLPDNLKETYIRMRDVIDSNADALVEAGALAEKNKIQDYLKRYYEEHLKEGSLLQKFYFNERFKARKELTHDERIALGMIEDANFVIPKTLAEQRVQLLKAQTLKNLADTFGSDVEKEGFVRMSDESMGGGVKKYGALAGKYVPKEVHDAIKGAGIVKENVGPFETYLYPVIDHIKVNLTVKNPFTHIYNVGSNIMLSFLHGDISALAKVVSMAMNDKAKFDKLVARANKYGLNSSLDMMEKITPFSDTKEPIVMTILKNAYFAKGSKSGDFARHMYDWEDKIFKLASFYRHLSEGVDEKTAFKLSQEAYVDYTTPIPATVRVVDKMGLMPFIHYSYKATPMVLKAIAKHPIRYTVMQAALLGTGASAWLGDNEKENMYKPSWAQSWKVSNLFGVKSWVSLGGGWQLNAGRLVPGMRFDGFDTLEFSWGFLGGAYRIINGETPLGYKIDGKYDDFGAKITKRTLEMAKNYLPPVSFGRYGQQLVGKATGLNEPKNYYDEKMGYSEMLLRGAGVRHFNEAKEVKAKANVLKNALKHAKEKAKEKNDPSIETNARREYEMQLSRLRGGAMSVNLDLSKY